MPISSDTLAQSLPRMGRRSTRPEMSKTKATRLAASMVSANRVSPEMEKLIRVLSTAGALTTVQIKNMAGLGLRTLQRYFFDSKNGTGHVLDYYRADEELATKFGCPVAKGLRHPRVWTLGILGRAIATQLGETPYTYNGFHIRQLTHDVLCAQCVWTLVSEAEKSGYSWQWFSKHDARILDDKGKIKVEPDAKIVLTRNKESSIYFVEFHNEAGSSRARKKSYIYHTSGFEHVNVLVFCRTVATINGYAREYAEWRREKHIRFYGRTVPGYFQKDSKNTFLNIHSTYKARLVKREYTDSLVYDEKSKERGKYVILFENNQTV